MAPGEPPTIPGYRLTRHLGSGSTATVWRARRESDDELVAVKVVPDRPEGEALREWAVLQDLAVEHVVRLHETVDVETSQGPAVALVLDHLAGGSLGALVAGRGHLTPGECVTVLVPLAQALAGLHARGVVHGDLSPGNVLLESTGRPVLADLGYARVLLEREVDVHGTDGYLAPEVAVGRLPDEASDVHALGALAWLCLTGRAPGHAAARPPLDELAPGAPESLVRLVEECLDPDPAQRPTPGEIAADALGSIPAEPLRLVAPGDVAGDLTRRIREAVADPGPLAEVPVWERELPEEEPRRRWWQRGRDTADTPAAHEGRRGQHRAPTRVSWPRWVATLAAAATVGVLLSTVVPWDRVAAADPVGVSSPPESGSAVTDPPGPTAGGAGRSGCRARCDSRAPSRNPEGLMQELSQLRATVMTTRHAPLVDELAHPGSSAHRADRELVARLLEDDVRYSGLRFSVHSAHLLDESSGRAGLRATIDQEAYTVVSPRGRSQEPAAGGTALDFELRWGDGTWRVVSVSEPARPR